MFAAFEQCQLFRARKRSSCRFVRAVCAVFLRRIFTICERHIAACVSLSQRNFDCAQVPCGRLRIRRVWSSFLAREKMAFRENAERCKTDISMRRT
ncbi:MAG: hypothetical protein DBX55_03925 [Verrucomicrobia bacterium]|nr:MAG: hypothetical protein DBX55_03925 [Verrucomicrobiota bacterium]